MKAKNASAHAANPADLRDKPDPDTHRQKGLNAQEVEQRLRLGLVNVQPKTVSRSFAVILRTHVMTLFNLVIGVCALIIIALGRWFDLLFAVAAVSNIVIGLGQEYSAKRKLDAVALIHQDIVRVLRDGMVVELHRENIVLDDVVELRRGDQIPADGVVLSVEDMDIDESMLTGEAAPVMKRIGDHVFSGTAVVSGSAYFTVTGIGQNSRVVQLASTAKKYQKINSEIRRSLEKIALWLSVALLPVMALVFNGQMQAHGGWVQATSDGQWRQALITSVSSVTAMIPQGLALMSTIAFAISAVKLAQDSVLIQEQPAVEILARVNTVCFDKTGTLTDGTLCFREAKPLKHIGAEPSAWTTVLAAFASARGANHTAAALAEAFPNPPTQDPVSQVAFSSRRRWSALSYSAADPALAGTWILGAPELIHDCVQDGSFDPVSINAEASALASAGHRTLMLYHSSLASNDQPGLEELPRKMRPITLLSFTENIRPDAADTVGFFREQGVSLRVISGDHPQTVASIAQQIGMEFDGEAINASTLGTTAAELREVAASAQVFGRVTPEQKAALVQAMQLNGEVVAMTGDGINDALAVKNADVGIAMGDGAPATKAVSRMVLLDKKFSRLPAVLEEGRKVIANTERLAQLFLTKTAYAVLLGVAVSLVFWEFPFLPRQFSTVDFLIIGFPAFFLALMSNARRYRPGFLKRSALSAIPAAVAITVSLLAVSAIGHSFSQSPAQIQTASMICLSITGLWVLNTALRPLDLRKVSLLVGMYFLVLLVLLLPISQAYHLFALPQAPLIVASVISGIVGCAGIEGAYRWNQSRIEQSAVQSPATQNENHVGQ